jgi:hypothetical protein
MTNEEANEYIGIDYSMGLSNRDRSTGIHYGVISANTLHPNVIDEEFESDYGDPTCPKCGGNVEESNSSQDKKANKDFFCPECFESYYNEDVYGEEPIGHTCVARDYDAYIDSYNDVMITKSLYYTTCAYCSPCCPGAGHLENFRKTGIKTYCFDRTFFEDEKCPYPYWDVQTDELVYQPEPVQTEMDFESEDEE